MDFICFFIFIVERIVVVKVYIEMVFYEKMNKFDVCDIWW